MSEIFNDAWGISELEQTNVPETLPREVQSIYLESVKGYYQSLLNAALLDAIIINKEADLEELSALYHEEIRNKQRAFAVINGITEKYNLGRETIMQLIADDVRCNIYCRAVQKSSLHKKGA